MTNLYDYLYIVYIDNTAPAAQPFIEQSGPKVPPSCQDCLSLVFDDTLLQYLADNTNTYAMKQLATMTISSLSLHRNWRPVTVDERKGFIAVVLNMGIVQLTNLKDYWSTDDTTKFPLSSPETDSSRSLACCMWEIQMAPPSAARSSLCLTVSLVFEATFTPDKLSVINFKGRVSFHQYLKGNPHPWGI